MLCCFRYRILINNKIAEIVLLFSMFTIVSLLAHAASTWVCFTGNYCVCWKALEFVERYWTVIAVTVIRFYNSIYFIRLANSIAIIFISRNFRESSKKLGKKAETNLVLLSGSTNLVIHWKLVCTDQIRFYNFLRSRKLSNVQHNFKIFQHF